MTFSNPIYTVLYIDKDEEKLKAFEAAFGQDYHAYTASSGMDAMSVLDTRTIQLVITGRNLADMKGLDFLGKIVSLYPDSMRMILSGEEDLEEVVRAADRGIVFRYIILPCKQEELKISIENALEVYNLKRQNNNLICSLEEIKQTLQQKVMERTKEIEKQRLSITDSILYASRIQNALMLSRRELEDLLPSYFILNKPKDIVSGDFYWVSKKNEKLVIVVADCTGHGVPGAFMSVLGISLLNEIVSNLDNPGPADILNELRSHTIRALGQTGRIDEAREGMEMALCMIDPHSRIIQFSGAFRPMFLVSQGEINEVRGDRMPIGIYHEKELPFTEKQVAFGNEDILYLFSDGYVDQIGGLDRKTFRSLRFKKLIREIWDRPMKDQEAVLREEIEIWRAGQEQIDDIMVLGLKLSGLLKAL